MAKTERDQVEAAVVVIGAGPGGYAAAFRAADLGLDVLLVDPEPNPGGVCLYRGCIPSKAYLHVARVLREARDASAFGVEFEPPRIDIERLRGWKGEVVDKLTAGLAGLAKAKGVRLLRGRASFDDSTRLHVDLNEPRTVDVTFEHAIVATGSRPLILDQFLPDSDRVMSSTGALELADIPARLLVIGGGYIGLELGTVYAELGARVTIVEMTKRLLPGVDRDLVVPVARSLAERAEAIHLETSVESLEETTDAVRARLVKSDGTVFEEAFDRVLVAVGRRPNTSGLGLASTAVELDERGFIKVDAARRSAEPAIFAIGDVTGEPMLAHKATHEGLVAAEVIAGDAGSFEPAAIPAVVFTDPEIAWSGLSEADAKDAGREVKIARFPWQASGRAATLGRSDGVTKLVLDPQSERVLGVGIVGAGAGELIAEATLAIEMGAVATDLAATIHAHPTLSETLMESAEVFYGRSVHLHRKR